LSLVHYDEFINQAAFAEYKVYFAATQTIQFYRDNENRHTNTLFVLDGGIVTLL